MATKQSTSKKKMNKQSILTTYMDLVLEDQTPKSVHAFCKLLKIEEPTFYSYFSSLEMIKHSVWETFFDHVTAILSKDDNYANYPNREKLLAFFYTFFELLTANRSYVLLQFESDTQSLNNVLGNKIQNLKQLKGLRIQILDFATQLREEQQNSEEVSKVKEKFIEKTRKYFSESVWLQFLFLLKFWKEDTSANFEKTDVAIEKSVQTLFDVIDQSPLERIFDFGKFLWNERKF